ncbi:MAG TPA: AI-2E family transporter [Streptosporangiaceae bacterium]|jgi:predicted PurR-regulated permease PerM|nr:AI-2E family transporter [Streptosporangiaceae bacterium]
MPADDHDGVASPDVGQPEDGVGGIAQPGAGGGTPPDSSQPPAGWPDRTGTGDADLAAAGQRQPEPQVPGWLQRAAAWSWRLLLVGLLIYVAFRVASVLRVVVLPCIAALLLTALLQPLMARLRRLGLPALAATWCTLLLAVAVLAGVTTLAATRTTADYPTLVNQLKHTVNELQRSLAGPPFHLHHAGIQALANRVVAFLKQHQSAVAGTVVTGGKIFLEILAGFVLMLFVTFFLLKDGSKIWGWLVHFLGPDTRGRATRAGDAAWQVLRYYVRGTVTVAAIHAIVIGFSLWVLGVPLLIPLVILVFLAAFIPLIGILVAGALAVAVTLATKGWIAAVVLIAIFILENQLESHLLQPLVVGRLVRLHPLAIILVLTVGGVVAGIPGAIVAVPTAAALVRAAPYLRRRAPAAPGGPGSPPAVTGTPPAMGGSPPAVGGGLRDSANTAVKYPVP